MPSWWLTALAISGAMYGLAVWRLRPVVGIYSSLLLSFPFMPCALFQAMSSGNSYVYLGDIYGPILIILAWKSWRQVKVKWLVVSLFLSVGFLPFLSLLPMGDRMGWMMGSINAYRSLVLSAYVAYLSLILRGRSDAVLDRVVEAIWIGNLIICITVLLQLANVLDTNVLSHGYYGKEEGDVTLEYRFIKVTALGFYRSTQGIFGMLGALAAIHRLMWNSSKKSAWAGFFASFSSILLIGSKTSLLCSIVSPMAVFLARSRFRPRMIAATSSFGAACLTLLVVWYDKVQVVIFDYLESVGASKESISNLSGRDHIWKSALDAIERDPSILLGIASPKLGAMMQLHDEWLNIVGYGGVLALAFYLVLNFRIFQAVKFKKGMPPSIGILLLVAMLIQSLTVGHLQPLMFMQGVICLFFIFYLAESGSDSNGCCDYPFLGSNSVHELSAQRPTGGWVG